MQTTPPSPNDDTIESLGLSGTVLMQLWSIGVARVSDLTAYNTDGLRKKLIETINGSAAARERIEKTLTEIHATLRERMSSPGSDSSIERVTEKEDEDKEPENRPEQQTIGFEPDHEWLDQANASIPRFNKGTLEQFYRDIKRYPQLSRPEQADLGRRVLDHNDTEARNLLVLHNLRLVLWVARKHLWATVARGKEMSGLTFADLVQEGAIGLMTAADRYDYRRGFTFSTYATWWIRHEITRAIANSGFVRIPVHLGELLSKVYRVMGDIAMREGRVPTANEIAKTLEITPAKVKSALRVSRMYVQTLNQPDPGVASGTRNNPGYGEPEEWLTTLADAGGLRADHIIEAREELMAACERINMLTTALYADDTILERNREIFVQFYGLDGSLRHRTLEHVGEAYKVTRERVRQIIAKCWEKLQQSGELDMDHQSVISELSRIGALEGLAEKRVSVD